MAPCHSQSVAETETDVIAKADLTLAGRTVLEAETIPIGKADIGLAGQAVTTFESQLIPVDAASVSFAGKTVLVTENEVIAKANVGFAGQDVATPADAPPDTTVITPAAVSLTGQNVSIGADTEPFVEPQRGSGFSGTKGKPKKKRKIVRDPRTGALTLLPPEPDKVPTQAVKVRTPKATIPASNEAMLAIQQAQDDDEVALLLMLAA